MPASRDPETLGPFVLIDSLGQGGMGVVYRARPIAGGEEVALKTTRHASPEEVARIRSEIQALAGIRHPGIVRFLDHGVVAGVPWYTMDLLRGATLRVWLNQLWPAQPAPTAGSADTTPPSSLDQTTNRSSPTWIDPGAENPELEPITESAPRPVTGRRTAANGRLIEALTICHRLCAPLSVMHGRGIVHRDLKPENVFLRGETDPVLMDLGLVAQAGGSIGRERLDEGGRVLGTVAYMAPEQAEGGLVDTRADLYALGAMLYELVTGERTVRGSATPDALQRVRTETPPAPSTLVDGVSPALDELVMRLLAKSPRERLGHADDVARALVELGVPDVALEVPATSSGYLYRPTLRGRAEHRATLNQQIDALKSGSGAVTVIAGESGAGKTFLALQVASLAGRRRVGLLTGECLPVSSGEEAQLEVLGAPLHPFRRFLQACADKSREKGPEYAEKLLGPRARVLAPFEAALASTAAYARHGALEAVGAESSRERVLNALGDTLEAWTELEGPLVLLLDDWQWADELSFAALWSFNTTFLEKTALLVVCTWRSDEITKEHEHFAAQRHVTVLHLARLDRTAVAEMVGDMLAMPEAPTQLVDFLTAQTEGNPFFVAEYLRMAATEQILRRDRGRWVLNLEGDVRTLPAPGSLQGLIDRRLDGLTPVARRVLEVAAVLGRHVRTATLLGALGSADLDLALGELANRQILEVEEGGWHFIHDKLREVAFARVPDERRPPLHRSAAEALEAARELVPDDAFEWAALARHWSEAGEPARAMRAWARAGDQATRNFCTGEAKEAYTAALALADAGKATALEEARWQYGLADACLHSGETKAGIEHAGRALAEAGFPLPRTSPGWFFGFLGQFALRVTQAYVPGPFAVAAGERQDRTTLAARASQLLLEPYFLANMPLQGLYVGLRCINLGERVPDTIALARGLGFMTMLLGATPLRAVADRWAARAVALAEASGKRDALVYILNRSSCYHVAMGRWADVIRNSIRARDMAAEIGYRRGFEEAHTVWDQALHASGRYADALDVQQTLIAASSKRGDKETLAMGLVKYVENRVRCGKPQEALAAYTTALADMPHHGEGIQAYFHGVASEAALQSGDLVRARGLADEAWNILKKTPPTSYFSVPGLISGAHTYLALHRATGDATALDGAVAMGKWLGSLAGMYPYAAPANHRIAGEIAARQGKSAARSLERAVESARDLAMPVEEGLAHLALSRSGPEAERAAHAAEGARLLGASGTVDWVPAA